MLSHAKINTGEISPRWNLQAHPRDTLSAVPLVCTALPGARHQTAPLHQDLNPWAQEMIWEKGGCLLHKLEAQSSGSSTHVRPKQQGAPIAPGWRGRQQQANRPRQNGLARQPNWNGKLLVQWEALPQKTGRKWWRKTPEDHLHPPQTRGTHVPPVYIHLHAPPHTHRFSLKFCHLFIHVSLGSPMKPSFLILHSRETGLHTAFSSTLTLGTNTGYRATYKAIK